jgi:hypothetical protein
MKKSEEISFGEDRNQSHRPELLPEITSLRRERRRQQDYRDDPPHS